MLLTLADVCFVSAQEKPRIAWAGGASSAPIWIVQEKGLMRKQGVNAEIIRVGVSTMDSEGRWLERQIDRAVVQSPAA